MAATITDNIKKAILEAMIADFSDAENNYYVALGRAEYWDSSDTPPTPRNDMDEQRKFRNSVQALKKVRGVEFVVPRNNWSSGTVYNAWDDTQVGYAARKYYVMNSNFQVYICLRQGKDANGDAVPSTVNPTGSNNDPFETSDGYVWKFLYTIGELNAKYFLSSSYMPVTFVDSSPDSDASGVVLKQWEVQQAAKPYMLSSVAVAAAGSGYTSAPTATIVGNGNESDGGDHLTVTIDSAGTITRCEINNEGSTLNYIHNLEGAEIVLTGGGGSGGELRPIISSSKGFGADAREDLKASAIMFNSKIEGDDSDFIVTQDFRQIALIKNPLDSAGEELFTDETGNALTQFNLNVVTSAFSTDKTIEGQTSGAQAFIDRVGTNVLFIHQNDSTGFEAFTAGEVIEEVNGPGVGTLDSSDFEVAAEVDPASGDILYIDNRTAVSRTATQSEDVKIVIQI